MDEENLFDEDEALDFIVYEELQKEENNPKSGGCLSTIILLVIPTFYFTLAAYRIVTT